MTSRLLTTIPDCLVVQMIFTFCPNVYDFQVSNHHPRLSSCSNDHNMNPNIILICYQDQIDAKQPVLEQTVVQAAIWYSSGEILQASPSSHDYINKCHLSIASLIRKIMESKKDSEVKKETFSPNSTYWLRIESPYDNAQLEIQ